MSPSGPPVTTYCMRADAPGRSGWLSAIFLVSSNQSCVSHFDICSLPGHRDRAPETVPCRGMLASGGAGPTGEQVVLHVAGTGSLGAVGRGRSGQDVLVHRVDVAHDLRRQPEPEGRLGVDLGGVRQKSVAADVGVLRDVDER